VAEDNVVNQKIALRQLKKLGYSADAVANGLEAVEAVNRIPYDIVLMDCQMPELDGFEATRRIRQAEEAMMRPGRRPVYVIAMTANALEGNREGCLAAGMNDYVSKPVRLPELQAVLRRAVRAPQDGALMEDAPRLENVEGGDLPVLDRAVLDSLKALQEPGEEGMVEELIGLFLRDTPVKIASLEEALREARWPVVKESAHGLKGTASNLGARRLAALCGRLEKLAMEGGVLDASEWVGVVQGEYDRVSAALREEPGLGAGH
jgi:CheY-like chemotaxis protein